MLKSCDKMSLHRWDIACLQKESILSSDQVILGIKGLAGSLTNQFYRWFTPAAELPLCGHGTLASAAAIFQGKHQVAPCITFSDG